MICLDDSNSRNVYVGISGRKGRGVFARRRIAAGEIFETAQVLLIPAADWPAVANTMLFDYSFQWGDDGDAAAIAMGYGSFYNHSYESNARYDKRFEDFAIEFVALRDIEPGEEIVVNYNGEPGNRDPLWFPVSE